MNDGRSKTPQLRRHRPGRTIFLLSVTWSIALDGPASRDTFAQSLHVSVPAVTDAPAAIGATAVTREPASGSHAASAAAAAASGLRVGLNFTSSTLFTNSFFIPPDTMGAVGPRHIVELINGRYAVYERKSATLVRTSALDEFWSAAGVRVAGFTFDPRVLFDPLSQRWFALSVDNAFDNNHFLIAVSRSSDPTSGWTGFAIDSDTSNQGWADFPRLGVNGDGVYLVAHMFPFASGPITTTFIIIPKVDLVSRTPTTARATRFENFPVEFGIQPAVDVDDSSSFASFVSTPFFFSDALSHWEIRGDVATPLPLTASVIPVRPFVSRSSAVQPGLQENLEIANGVMLHANAVVRNGAMWGVHTVEHEGRAALRWFQIAPDTHRLLQEGLIADDSLEFYYGSIAVNEFEDVVIGFSGSSQSQFVSSYAVSGRTVAGTTTFGTPLLLKAGVDTYERFGGGRNRWGDYSATVIDPIDPFTFWTFQEFVSDKDIWSTQITQLTVDDSREKISGDTITFDPVRSTMRTTSDTAGCPVGFVGKFTFEGRMTNTSGALRLSDLTVIVSGITNGNRLQNGDRGAGGVGTAVTVPSVDDVVDGVLGPGDSVDAPFVICLKQRKPFTFLVDVFGTVR